jgi:hypothetical protein
LPASLGLRAGLAQRHLIYGLDFPIGVVDQSDVQMGPDRVADGHGVVGKAEQEAGAAADEPAQP